ncbi:MAG: lipopolysaccharide transport periplasmic protein LptA [Rubrivivax sp.]|nr:lipopolysaccharide transport periplasmic protein LptA [Rubrivivax sp.]
MIPPRISWFLPSAAALATAVLATLGFWPLAHAERADRSKPMVVEADRPGTVDLQRQVVVFNGNVVISQGTMVLRADRVEMRETPDGFRAATAIGGSGRQASWRQRRDGSGEELVEGVADRIEFDGKADTLRFMGNGSVRRMRAGTVADEITGATIVWDNLAEVFRVEGGAATAANPTGRVRVVLSPRAEPAAGAASGAASGPAVDGATAPLAPSRGLGGDRR